MGWAPTVRSADDVQGADSKGAAQPIGRSDGIYGAAPPELAAFS